MRHWVLQQKYILWSVLSPVSAWFRTLLNFHRLLNQSSGVLIAEFYTLANVFLQLNGKQIFIEPPDLKHVEDYRYILRLILEKRKEKKKKKNDSH